MTVEQLWLALVQLFWDRAGSSELGGFSYEYRKRDAYGPLKDQGNTEKRRHRRGPCFLPNSSPYKDKSYMSRWRRTMCQLHSTSSYQMSVLQVDRKEKWNRKALAWCTQRYRWSVWVRGQVKMSTLNDTRKPSLKTCLQALNYKHLQRMGFPAQNQRITVASWR